MRSLLYAAVAICLIGYVFSVEDDADSAKERFIALYKTATYVTVATSTISTPYFCYTGTATVPCGGRKRRRRQVDLLQKMDLTALEDQAAQLRGSISEDAAQAESSERDARLGFTVWTTQTSTLTLTTTSFDTATTVSLSYACTVAGYNSVPVCA